MRAPLPRPAGDRRGPTPAARRAAAPDVLGTLSRRARRLRQERGLTLRALATRSGLSLRFLMAIESGQGNISVRRLADLAAALDTTPADLLGPGDERPPTVIALLGLRGSGKTTIGRRVARRLRLRFVELDRQVEALAGLALGEIFSLHGEEYYRRLEREALTSLLETRQSMVLASGGGLVAAPETFALLARRTTTVWLRATADDCWERVIRQGDRRPMNQHPQARKALTELVARRNPLYAQAAITVDTSGRSVAETVEGVIDAAALR
jgi:XRE family aerobic/anaerobic benzoate catabolism transcriptional regulator